MAKIRTRRDQRVIDHQTAICAWLDANGIPHADVPIDARPTIRGGTITIDIYQRRPDGRLRVVGQGATATVARMTFTRPLRVPLPAGLAWWAA